jgi:predicted transcriptional regulator
LKINQYVAENYFYDTLMSGDILKIMDFNSFQNRSCRRFAKKFRRRSCKNYFVLSNEALELYRQRVINATDVVVFCYLSSLRRRYDGVRVSQKRIAAYCGISSLNTVSSSIQRLYNAGLIEEVVINTRKAIKKYETSIYILKPLLKSGFSFVPRSAFAAGLKAKEFVVFVFMCSAYNFEYGKSWNSYNDICDRLGFSRNSRSEIVKIVGRLVETGLLTKKVRRIKNVYVDNIYRVANYLKEAARKIVSRKEWKERQTNPCKMSDEELEFYLNTIPHIPDPPVSSPEYVQITLFATDLIFMEEKEEDFPF